MVMHFSEDFVHLLPQSSVINQYKPEPFLQQGIVGYIQLMLSSSIGLEESERASAVSELRVCPLSATSTRLLGLNVQHGPNTTHKLQKAKKEMIN